MKLHYGKPGLSRKFHIFLPSGRALCYNYHFTETSFFVETDRMTGPPPPTDCRKCWERAQILERASRKEQDASGR